MEVMVWSVSYWNLKMHIDIGKTYPTKKISFLAQFKVPYTVHTLSKISLTNLGKCPPPQPINRQLAKFLNI